MAHIRGTRLAARPLQGTMRFAHSASLSPALVRLITVTLAYGGLCLLLISLRPFPDPNLILNLSEGNGDALNQFGFIAAGLVYVLMLATFANPKALSSLLSPTWLMLLALLVFSIATSTRPIETTRSLVLTLIGMLVVFSVLVLPRGERDFRIVLTLAALTLLGLCYAGLVVMPSRAMHNAGELESQHAGLWRGTFAHKNVAGPVMSVLAIFGIYIYRSGSRFAGAAVFLLSFLFVMHTGSKTTLGFLPMAILIVMAATVFGRSWIVIALHVLAFAGAFTLTIGTLWSKGLTEFIGKLLGDETYTGRVTLWEFGLANVGKHPWFGFGYGNFWDTPTVLNLDTPIEAAWDFRGIVHGHNNYIDMLLNLGVIGGGVVIWVFFIAPLFNYVRARRRPGNRKLADMFMMIVVFLTLLSLLETFFLRRIDPIWLMDVFAVLGLHLLARFDIGDGAIANVRRQATYAPPVSVPAAASPAQSRSRG